jgi:hypothetical protein
MDAADLSRFETALGFPLPPEFATLGSMSPYLESDIDRLIFLNRDVREPGTPWIGEEGGPWPDEHIVIGENQCGDYWSVIRSERPPTEESGSMPVYFLDHEVGTLTEAHPSLESFLAEIRETYKPEVFEVGDWTLRAQTSVGPIHFGMTPDELRATLNEPYTPFKKSLDSPDPTDAFDTLSLHAYYREGKCEAIEFFSPANVKVGGSRLGEKTFNDMVGILYDPVMPLKTTATSCISRSFGIEFSIERADQADVVGAIHMIIVTDPGYFDRQDAALKAILGDDYQP